MKRLQRCPQLILGHTTVAGIAQPQLRVTPEGGDGLLKCHGQTQHQILTKIKP